MGDVSNYFLDKFNINFNNFEKWDSVVEASLRRNLIIHNQSKTDNKYCEQTGHKKLGALLKTDIKYIKNTSNALIEFIKFTSNNIQKNSIFRPNKSLNSGLALVA